eukprot:1606335-Rhodomonas_salina.2
MSKTKRRSWRFKKRGSSCTSAQRSTNHAVQTHGSVQTTGQTLRTAKSTTVQTRSTVQKHVQTLSAVPTLTVPCTVQRLLHTMYQRSGTAGGPQYKRAVPEGGHVGVPGALCPY